MASGPLLWLRGAVALRTVAMTVARNLVGDAVRQRPGRRRSKTTALVAPDDFWRVFMMLAGYALEVLAKGIIVAEHPDQVRDRESWARLTSGHDLEALLKRAGIGLEPPEQQFVRRASTAVTWFGRYPVPKRVNDMRNLKWGLPSHADVDVFRDI